MTMHGRLPLPVSLLLAQLEIDSSAYLITKVPLLRGLAEENERSKISNHESAPFTFHS
jgi:hypothetical protein